MIGLLEQVAAVRQQHGHLIEAPQFLGIRL
ncbi:MAG: hypothetical protein RLZZ137_46, partial [Cyanobacteriota bacterium]